MDAYQVVLGGHPVGEACSCYWQEREGSQSHGHVIYFSIRRGCYSQGLSCVACRTEGGLCLARSVAHHRLVVNFE